MHIIIIGGGIAGLSTYLALSKHLPSNLDYKITIFDAHSPRSCTSSYTKSASGSTLSLPNPHTKSTNADTAAPKDSVEAVEEITEPDQTPLVTGGLLIPPNGMSMLRSLSQELHDAVVSQGTQIEKVVIKAANGWELGTQDCRVRNPRNAPESDKASSNRGGNQNLGPQEYDEDVEEYPIATSRHALLSTLLHFVGEDKITYRKVTAVERFAEGRVLVRSVACESETDEHGSEYAGTDEEVEIADLVIGADGLESVVREYVFETYEEGEVEWCKPYYTGLTTAGGFLAHPASSGKSLTLILTHRGLISYTPCAPSSGSTSQSPTFTWQTTFPTPPVLSPSAAPIPHPSHLLPGLQTYFTHVHDPIIHTLLHSQRPQSQSPITYFHNCRALPSLPFWGRQSAILIGDAAHALCQTSGQGEALALEDAETLALLLSGCLARSAEGRLTEREAVTVAMFLMFEVRKPRVRGMAAQCRRVEGWKKGAGTLGLWARYGFVWASMRWAWLGKFKYGLGDPALYTWSAEEEVRKALQKVDDNRYEELRLLSRAL